ncbi:MAG: hypothetical protein LBB11_03780 [Puniceicoccales bacterium]|jgi:hypothetical protein|nr:hypothetical protein [Puniceicoccales bacterium]
MDFENLNLNGLPLNNLPKIDDTSKSVQGGTFLIRNGIVDGTVKIEKIDNGNIQITEEISISNRSPQSSSSKKFKTHKKAMAYLKKNPNADVTVTITKTYKNNKKANAWLKRNVTPDSTIDAIKKTSNFKKCSPEQQKHIEQYARQMIEKGDKAEFASRVCNEMATIYKGASNLRECSPELKKYIEPYVRKTIERGNKAELVELRSEMLRAMATIYRNENFKGTAES